MKRASQGYCQGALSAAEWSGPGEATLVGARKLLAHAADYGSRRCVADVTRERVYAADVSIYPDGALVLA